jgi:ATP-binding cassette subfamily B protein
LSVAKREFTIINEYHYNRASPRRWIASHLLRYKHILFGFMCLSIAANSSFAVIAILTGRAFNAVTLGGAEGWNQLATIALILAGVVLFSGLSDLGARVASEFMCERVARDARNELYVNLLGKSQTFHNRQRVGDIMARAANDMNELRNMVVPGFDIIFDSFTSLIVTIIFISLLNPQLLLAPLLFVAMFIIALRAYSKKLNPISNQMRAQFGTTNAILNEAVTGIEVVKATSQEEQ